MRINDFSDPLLNNDLILQETLFILIFLQKSVNKPIKTIKYAVFTMYLIFIEFLT